MKEQLSLLEGVLPVQEKGTRTDPWAWSSHPSGPGTLWQLEHFEGNSCFMDPQNKPETSFYNDVRGGNRG